MPRAKFTPNERQLLIKHFAPTGERPQISVVACDSLADEDPEFAAIWDKAQKMQHGKKGSIQSNAVKQFRSSVLSFYKLNKK